MWQSLESITYGGCRTAMKEDYTDTIQQVSQVVFEAIKDREDNLLEEVKELDGELAKLLRLVGREVMSMSLNDLADQVTTKSKKKGLVVHRREKIKYSVIFGIVEVNSPYLWHKQEGWGVRPVVEKLGIKPNDRSIALIRTLTDFGAEESFGQAAKRFQEHYGWTVERGAIRREVEAIANEAESFVEKRLLALETKFTNFQFILDYAHFKQHLYQAVEAMELEQKWRSIWLNCAQDLIEGGRVKTIISRLKHWSGQGKEVVFNFTKYLERFRQSVHYKRYREWGLPIGSGEIESSHRYIPQKRLKIPGATWHPDTINPMLALRVIRANNWWNDFWQTISFSSKTC
jgi:hypothetical protein